MSAGDTAYAPPPTDEQLIALAERAHHGATSISVRAYRVREGLWRASVNYRSARGLGGGLDVADASEAAARRKLARTLEWETTVR